MDRHGSHCADTPGPALAAYGWSGHWEASFAPYRATGHEPARIVRVDRGWCDLVTARGMSRAEAGRPGSGDPISAPCTGDWAALRPSRRADEPPALAGLLPRRTALVRSSSSARSVGQVLAANVDIVAVLVPLTVSPNLSRLERMLALAWESGAQPLVVLTKADEVTAAEAGAVRAEVATAAPGVEVLTTSAASGEGVDTLTALLTGTVVLIGQSGVGKSTLANVLVGADRLAVSGVRSQDGKGRHTTVRRELVPLPGGGVLVDTPGLRGVGLYPQPALPTADDGVALAFTDIEDLAQGCRYGDCGHRSEPGCAVLAAVDAGDLSPRRLDSYRKLLRENEWIASRSDARLRAERDRQWRTIHRSQRQMYKLRGH